jgi:hypothetical protein
MKKQFSFILMISLFQLLLASCTGQTSNSNKQTTTSKQSTTQKTPATSEKQTAQNFVEGKDYNVFDRVRIMDNQGFQLPVEAYSLLLPKGWQHQGEIMWTMPGQTCAGNNAWLKATSPDNKYSLEFLPNQILSWMTNQQLLQWNMQNQGNSKYCIFNQPIGAEQYLRSGFVQELGNPQIVKAESNSAVVTELQNMFQKGRAELMQYGAQDVQGYSSAVNAEVKWNDGTEGFVILGVMVYETTIANTYTGTYDKSYTTSITKKTVFKYPAAEKEKAKSLFAVIMASMRSNTAYNDAVNSFWRQVRQDKNRVHWEKIRVMDEQTRRIGEQAIAKGNQRLKDMDTEMRTWEAKQSSQDKMHTDFIKTIREVENFRDETGKYEMVSGYNHAWSRGDGTSFVLSDNPNFDPAFVFKDQQWKQMKKEN